MGIERNQVELRGDPMKQPGKPACVFDRVVHARDQRVLEEYGTPRGDLRKTAQRVEQNLQRIAIVEGHEAPASRVGRRPQKYSSDIQQYI